MTDLDSAISALEQIDIPENLPDAYALGWQERARDLMRSVAAKVERLADAARGAPVRTGVAVTFTGMGQGFITVWADDAVNDDAGAHWTALRASLDLRRQLLRALTAAAAIAIRITAVLSAATNPAGALWAAARLGESVHDVLCLAQTL